MTTNDDDGDEHTVENRFWKAYNVFNAEQVEGPPGHYYTVAKTDPLPESERNAQVDRFIGHTGAVIERSNRAAYHTGRDVVLMPPLATFDSGESFYETLLHELTHWTRLDRDLGRKKWGDAGYAMEQLVADMAAAFLYTDLGASPTVREYHAQYIGAWLKLCRREHNCSNHEVSVM